LHPDDLHDFIVALEQAGELCRVKCSVDPHLEIAAVVNEHCIRDANAQALLFENVKGYQVPLAINLYGSRRRIELALGSDVFHAFPGKLREDLFASDVADSVAALRDIVNCRKNQANYVENAACFAADLTGLGLSGIPAIKAWPDDGGRYLTLGQVYTYHPETYAVNCGMYRAQLLDSYRALLRCHPGSGGAMHLAAWHARGEAMPVAIALGGPPVMTWLASVSLPGDLSETEFAGYLTGKPLEMGRCSNLHLAVPASAEIVIEGRIFPGEEFTEGPFGNHTGCYESASPAPVISIDKVSMRDRAIYPCTLVGPPPRENCCLADLTGRTLLVLMQFDHPWVLNLHMPAEGIFHRAAIVAVAQECPLPLAEISSALWTSALLRNSRLLILLDENDNLHDLRQVYWRVVNAIKERCFCHVDAHKVVLDARLPAGTRRVAPSEEIEQQVSARWHEYGLKGTK